MLNRFGASQVLSICAAGVVFMTLAAHPNPAGAVSLRVPCRRNHVDGVRRRRGRRWRLRRQRRRASLL